MSVCQSCKAPITDRSFRLNNLYNYFTAPVNPSDARVQNVTTKEFYHLGCYRNLLQDLEIPIAGSKEELTLNGKSNAKIECWRTHSDRVGKNLYRSWRGRTCAVLGLGTYGLSSNVFVGAGAALIANKVMRLHCFQKVYAKSFISAYSYLHSLKPVEDGSFLRFVR